VSDPEADLSGDWIGIYNYPERFRPVRFHAILHDADGWLSGTTSEEDEEHSPDAILAATIEGRRENGAVSFVKIYDDEEARPDIVRYQGRIQPGGDEIIGEWEVPGDWSGTFLMVRERGAEESVEQVAVEEIERD
jgi:hypothetical protein